MTGKQLAAAIKAHKGTVYVVTEWNDGPYIMAVKKDLIDYFKRKGSEELFLMLNVYTDRAYVGTDFEKLSEDMQGMITKESEY